MSHRYKVFIGIGQCLPANDCPVHLGEFICWSFWLGGIHFGSLVLALAAADHDMKIALDQLFVVGIILFAFLFIFTQFEHLKCFHTVIMN